MSLRSKTLPVVILVLFCALAPAAAQEGVHIVQSGENLFRIALLYDVDVPTLAQANGITNTWQIYAGQRLIIPGLQPPTPTPIPPTPEPQATATSEPEYVTIRAGQTLAAIARETGIDAEELAELNDITNPNLIYAGQRLLISGTSEVIDNAPVELLPENINPNSIRHVVQRGENLAAIGQRYGVSWLAIAQANDIFDADRIVAGQELLIPNILSGSDAILEVPAAPAPVHGIGREIIVDLSEQRTYAYENGVLVRNVVVSTGLPGTPTVRGDFTVQRKYVAQTMTGPGYYLPDVPYILYFYAGYALHGTYWHSNFGQPMSHGCVNLPTPEAEWFYSFADVGTPVHVQA
jgi:LysM repeat protein